MIHFHLQVSSARCLEFRHFLAMPRNFVSSNVTLHGGTPRKVMYGREGFLECREPEHRVSGGTRCAWNVVDNMHITHLGSELWPLPSMNVPFKLYRDARHGDRDDYTVKIGNYSERHEEPFFNFFYEPSFSLFIQR